MKDAAAIEQRFNDKGHETEFADTKKLLCTAYTSYATGLVFKAFLSPTVTSVKKTLRASIVLAEKIWAENGIDIEGLHKPIRVACNNARNGTYKPPPL